MPMWWQSLCRQQGRNKRWTGRKEVQASYKRGAGRYDDLLGTRKRWSKPECRLVWGFEDTAAEKYGAAKGGDPNQEFDKDRIDGYINS